MKKDRILFNKIMSKEVVGYKRYLLFTRKFNKEVYKFYLVTDRCWVDNEPMYNYWIETPENCLGYTDIISFTGGVGCGIHRTHANYIYKACKQALLKRGYRGGGLENDYRDFEVYFKD